MKRLTKSVARRSLNYNNELTVSKDRTDLRTNSKRDQGRLLSRRGPAKEVPLIGKKKKKKKKKGRDDLLLRPPRAIHRIFWHGAMDRLLVIVVDRALFKIQGRASGWYARKNFQNGRKTATEVGTAHRMRVIRREEKPRGPRSGWRFPDPNDPNLRW